MAPEFEVGALRHVSREEALSPLATYETQVRVTMGFADLSHRELVDDVDAARQSLAETGIRMRSDELIEFRARLALADDAAFLMRDLRAREDFAGFFFDPATSQYVARTTGDEDQLLELVDGRLPAGRIRVERAERSIRDLEAVAHSIVPVYDVEVGRQVDDLGPFEPYLDRISVMVRHEENEVWAFVDPGLPVAVLRNVEQAIGEAGRIHNLVGFTDEACVRDRCRPAIRPGARLYIGNGPSTCSAGLPFSNGVDTFLSTAGHCGPGSAVGQRLTSHFRDSLASGHGTFDNYAEYSASTVRRIGGDLDAQLFPIGRDLASSLPWGETDALTSSYWLNGVPAGTTMEVSRGNTYSVGSAVFDGYVTLNSRLVGLMRSDITGGGDSGSPWYVNQRAAGIHRGDLTYQTAPDWQNISRSTFEQVELIEDEFAVSFKADPPLPERLANDRFTALSSGWPTSWFGRPAPGGTISRAWYSQTGHLQEHGVEYNCIGAAGCSVYQDVSITTNTWSRITAGVWVFCNSCDACPVTLAVWGHGGATPAANLIASETIQPHDTAYLWVEGHLATGAHPLLRFEVYNGLDSGRNIRIASTELYR